MTPTPEAIEALALELAKFHSPKSAATMDTTDVLDCEYRDATWVLDRFVRREEHVAQFAVRDALIADLQCERDRLRAELRQQRCDGSGGLYNIHGDRFVCPGCPACQPKATPKGESRHSSWCWQRQRLDGGACYCDDKSGSHASDGLSALGNHVARLRASDGVSEAGERDSNAAPVTPTHCQVCGCGIASCPPDELPCHGHSPVVIELGPATLRTLVAGCVMAGIATRRDGDPLDAGALWAKDIADALLAHLKETKP